MTNSGPATDETAIRFDALAHERRRQVLAILAGADQPLSLTDLATEVARREADQDAIGADYERAEQIRVMLYHWHVPKLADAGFVEYDAETRTVTRTEVEIDAPFRPFRPLQGAE